MSLRAIERLIRKPPRLLLAVIGVPSLMYLIVGGGPEPPHGLAAIVFWAAGAFWAYMVVRGLLAYSRKMRSNDTATAAILIAWPVAQAVYNLGPEGSLHDARSAADAAPTVLITAMFVGLALLSAFELLRRSDRILAWARAPRRWFPDAKTSNLWWWLVSSVLIAGVGTWGGIASGSLLMTLIVVVVYSPVFAAAWCSARELRRRAAQAKPAPPVSSP